MDAKFLKRELGRLFSEAKKLERDLARNHLAWGEWYNSDDRDDGPPDRLVDEEESLIKPFEYLAKSLYLTTVCLLDKSGLHVYLRHFETKFGDRFDEKTAATEFKIDHYWSGEFYNVFLSDLRQFLEPLDILGDSSRYRKLAGVQYLETIINNTAVIIADQGKKPKSEPEVYKAVRHVLQAIFPTAKSPCSNFIKTAQEYKPDILIPELSVAVEYKYASDLQKLKSTIGQISDDVKGYTGDDDYNIFYAVFYVTQDFWGQARFREVWKEKEFPDNWLGIYIVGN